MTAEWNDSPKPLKVTSEHHSSLAVILQNHAIILPWSQFLYAEGSDDQVRLAFSTHDVVVTGSHLGELMADLSHQRISALRQPVRAETFGPASAVRITGIAVRKVE